jgi:hypothetical protein
LRGAGCLLLIALAPWCRAQDPTTEVTAQQVHFWSTPGSRSLNHGPYACWLRVRNDSATQAYTILLRARDSLGLVVDKRILLPPASQQLVPCIMPLATYHGNAAILVDGQRLPGSGGLEWATTSGSQGTMTAVLLVSRRLSFDLLNSRLNTGPRQAPANEPGVPGGAAESASEESGSPPTDLATVGGLPEEGDVSVAESGLPLGMTGFPGGPSGRPRAELVRLARAELEAQAWPTDWQFFGGFEGVALSADEFALLPAEAVGALVRYAECGGLLFVFGACPVPAGWERNATWEYTGLVGRAVGFGCWIGVPAADAAAITDEQADGMRQLLAERVSAQALTASALASRPVVERVTIPLKGTAAIIVLFALLAGPANLCFVIRRNRRLWLLWTTPLLGVAFSVAIVAYFTLGEGTGARARLQAITVLNETSRRATTFGIEGLYCPLPPRAGVAYEADWDVSTAVGLRPQAREMDLTGALRFRRGWVRSRVPINFAVRGSRHSAERLPLRFEGTRVVAVNGLGAPVDRLLVASADGRVWEARNLEPGAEAVLSEMPTPTGTRVGAGRMLSGLHWLEAPPSEGWMPAPGQYTATLAHSVFLKPILPGADYEQTAVVLGIPALPLGDTGTDSGSPARGGAAGADGSRE